MGNIYQVRKPEIVVANDMLGHLVSNSLNAVEVPFRREYHDDGAPAPKIDLNYTLKDYENFKGKKVITVYRRRQLPDRNDVARHLVSYGSIVMDLCDPETFNAEEVDVFYPYWLCGRADHNPKTDPAAHIRERDKGRGLGYKFEANLFKAMGAKRILTYHPHFQRAPGRMEVEGIEVVVLDAVPSLVNHAKNGIGVSKDALVIDPDMKPAKEGKYNIALEFARYGDFECDHLEKVRTGSSETFTKTGVEAKGREVIIVDDMGTSLTTMEGAVRNIKDAKSIDIIFVHPVLPQSGHRLANSMLASDIYRIRSISGTHTIDSDFSKIAINDELTGFYYGNEKYRGELRKFPDDFRQAENK